MKSMTGYGKAVVTLDGRELTVELKSVNHRFLDISTKIPRAFIAHEDIIRSGISKGISRGHIDVFINYKLDGDTNKAVAIDMALAQSYMDSVERLVEAYPQLRNDFSINSLIKSPEVMTLEQAEDDQDTIRKMLADAVEQAVANLNAMRDVEGNKLRTDLLSKIATVESLLEKVKQYTPQVALQYREKLANRVQEALQGVDIDQNKLANEVCFFVDKSCIDEEITRLTSHIAHAREILSLEEPVGRKLDFLVQEFNRETNTICSKSSYLELTNVALAMKNEIEKIREQVQNLE